MDSAPLLEKKVRCEAAHFGDALRQRPLILVVKKIRRVDQPRRLFLNDADDPRMILAERVHADARDEIEISLAVDVPHVRTVAANQNQRVTRVVLQQILTLEFDDVQRGRLPVNHNGHYFDDTGAACLKMPTAFRLATARLVMVWTAPTVLLFES